MCAPAEHRPSTFIVYEQDHFRAAFFHEPSSTRAIRYIMAESKTDFAQAMENGWVLEEIDECTGETIVIKTLTALQPEQCIV